MAKVYGKPAQYARMLARGHLRNTALLLLVAPLCLLVLVLQGGLTPLTSGGFKAILTGIDLLVGLGSAFFIKEFWQKYKKASIGASNETRVASVLKASPLGYVLNGLLLGAGGDADHIVLGPCVAIVETKSGSGHVQVKDGKIVLKKTNYTKVIMGDPIAQAKRQATKIARITSCNVTSVVCISGMTNKPFWALGALVTSPGDLVAALQSLPKVLDFTRAEILAKKLIAASKDAESI